MSAIVMRIELQAKILIDFTNTFEIPINLFEYNK